MIKRFLTYFNSFKTHQPIIPLGRWTRNQNTHLKVDWANIDHCGTCSFSRLDNVILKDEKNILNKVIIIHK